MIELPFQPIEPETPKVRKVRASALRTVETSLGSLRVKNTIGAIELDDPRLGIYLVLDEPQLILIHRLLKGELPC